MREKARIHAVDGVSLKIKYGETLSLVGESGSGKTTTGRCILGEIPQSDGKIVFMGHDLSDARKEDIRKLRRHMGVVFQDPYSSLNPRWKVGRIISEPVAIHKTVPLSEREEKVYELLSLVGLEPHHALRYPHEFSGGQVQRVAIARALAASPKFIVADEPVAALDVSVKAGILNLMNELKDKFELSYLLISHDLSAVRYSSDQTAVMYVGKIMEFAPTTEIFSEPRHPYTRALMSAVPIPDPTLDRKPIILPGDVPSPIDPAPICRFYSRCYEKTSKCRGEAPPLAEIDKGHFVACYNME